MKYTIALFAVLAASSAQATEIWDVTEGTGNTAAHGNWVVQEHGDSLSVSGTMFNAAGQKSKVELVGKKQGGIVSVQPTDKAAALDCMYRINVSPGSSSAVGSKICKSGTTAFAAIVKR